MSSAYSNFDVTLDVRVSAYIDSFNSERHGKYSPSQRETAVVRIYDGDLLTTNVILHIIIHNNIM